LRQVAVAVSDNTGATAAPTAIATNPVDGAGGVTLNTSITAFSDKELTSSTVNETIFTLLNHSSTKSSDLFG